MQGRLNPNTARRSNPSMPRQDRKGTRPADHHVLSLDREDSSGSNNTGDSTGQVPSFDREDTNGRNTTGVSVDRVVNRWFNRSNQRPEDGIHSTVGDGMSTVPIMCIDY